MHRRLVIAAAVGALCFAGAAARAETPAQFNLSCQGAFHDLLTDRRASFTAEFSVDLTTRVLCDAAYCMPLTRADRDLLEFNCGPKDGGTWCNRGSTKAAEGEIVISTGGPFVGDDHLSIDRHTGAYRRTTTGTIGDRAAKDFSAAYVGHCEARPFSEITPTD